MRRREVFKTKDWVTYRTIVKDQFMEEDKMCQVVLKEMLDALPETS